MGPSGSGKTSLLNILAGRVMAKPGFDIGGDVALNGTKVEPTEHQRIFGYVMQDDALHATSTPREILHFASSLRLAEAQMKESSHLADDLMSSLGLTKCADSLVGSEMLKGISGGEKKRVSIGAELITNPEILFLDEPTSGLDSFSSYQVISILRQLAHQQQVVLCTIHQPSSEILHLFDSVIFLAHGSIIYQGPPDQIRSYFESRGHPCHPDYNPSDFVMYLIQTAKPEAIEALIKSWQDNFASIKRDRSDEVHRGVTKDELKKLGTQSRGFFAEVSVLLPREFRNLYRDVASLIARFGVITFLSLIYAAVFWGTGDVTSPSYDLQSHNGCVVFIAITGMISAGQPLLLTFPFERPVFLREYASGMYGITSYFASKMIMELPTHMFGAAIMYLICYWSCAFNGSFSGVLLGTFAISAVAASCALLVGSAVSDIKKGIESIPAIFVPQILFAGFFIKIELIPAYLRWLQYTCFLKWGVNIVMTMEYKDIDTCTGLDIDPNSVSYDGVLPCVHGETMVLDPLDTGVDTLYLNYGILLGLFLTFRISAAFCLKAKARALYN